MCRRPGTASATCRGSSTRGSVRRRSPTTASEPRSRSTRPRSCCSRFSRKARRQRRRKLLAPILSIGTPDVTAQVGNWGDVYAGFQVPTADEPANWKFFSQFTTKPFPKKAIERDRLVHAERSHGRQQLLHPGLRRGGQAGAPRRHGVPAPRRALLLRARRRLGDSRQRRRAVGDPLTPTAQAWIAEFSQALRPLRERRLRQRAEHRDAGVGDRLLGTPTSTGCARSRRSTTPTTSSSTSRASRPRSADRRRSPVL